TNACVSLTSTWEPILPTRPMKTTRSSTWSTDHANKRRHVDALRGEGRSGGGTGAGYRAPASEALSVDLVQRGPLVGSDVVGLVALDLVLRLVLARPAHVPLVVEVLRVDLGDRPGHLTGLGVPPHVVPDLELGAHPFLLISPLTYIRQHAARVSGRVRIIGDLQGEQVQRFGGQLRRALQQLTG